MGSCLNNKHLGSYYSPLHILGRPKLLLQNHCNLAQLLSDLQTDHAKLKLSWQPFACLAGLCLKNLSTTATLLTATLPLSCQALELHMTRPKRQQHIVIARLSAAQQHRSSTATSCRFAIHLLAPGSESPNLQLPLHWIFSLQPSVQTVPLVPCSRQKHT